MSSFAWLTLAGWSLCVVAALLLRRTRQFAVFVGVLLGTYSLIALAVAKLWIGPTAVLTALHVTVYVNFALLARPRMRPLPYRLFVSWPSAFFAAGTLLALPWAIAVALGFHPWAAWLPYGLAAIGIVQCLRTPREVVHLTIGGSHVSELSPHPRGEAREERPLKVVQITDPHLGPFMSVARLRAIAERAVEERPDLVFLTGDFLTMESQSDPDLLLRALEPLAALEGRVFACHGNHDHEAPEVVARACRKNGIRLLVDESTVVETEAGKVQVVGMDFVWRDRKAHLERVCAAHPRVPDALRVILLHDPGAFRHLPEGEGDLVLSGHTHGGQLGLLSLGSTWTVLRAFGIRIPDNGFWARGTNRMYVHRGTGHYGFPLRLGVPAEESVLHVHRT
jgi:predicted MPP superfamily phosphohydrolase